MYIVIYSRKSSVLHYCVYWHFTPKTMIGVSFTLLCLLTFYPQDNDRGKFYIIGDILTVTIGSIIMI
jgi:hypothetical protein